MIYKHQFNNLFPRSFKLTITSLLTETKLQCSSVDCPEHKAILYCDRVPIPRKKQVHLIQLSAIFICSWKYCLAVCTDVLELAYLE